MCFLEITVNALNISFCELFIEFKTISTFSFWSKPSSLIRITPFEDRRLLKINSPKSLSDVIKIAPNSLALFNTNSSSLPGASSAI